MKIARGERDKTLTLPDAHFDLGGVEPFDVGPQVAVEDVYQHRLEHHLGSRLGLFPELRNARERGPAKRQHRAARTVQPRQTTPTVVRVPIKFGALPALVFVCCASVSSVRCFCNLCVAYAAGEKS